MVLASLKEDFHPKLLITTVLSNHRELLILPVKLIPTPF
jgi:hypothetical protein